MNVHRLRTVGFMSNTIKPEDLGKAIAEQLTIYHENVVDRVNVASQSAAESLVEKTKTTAPKMTGSYRRHIAWTEVETSKLKGNTYAWYVKAPDYRLTHLLVHGHLKKNGGRTRSDPFLQNAYDAVLSDYERDVEEAVKE